MREEGIVGLKIAGVAPELHRLLDAAVASLDASDRQTLLAPHVKIDTGAVLRRARVWRWTLGLGGAVLAATATGAWYSLRLRRELAERQRLQRELEASHARLARLNEEKSGLTRMAAHDLRNPLGGLLLSIELLRKDDETTRRRGLDRMVMMVHQMMHMIRNLLDVQALESGTRQMRLEPIVLGVALREALATLEPAAQRKAITLHLGEAEPALAVAADRSALRQVCDNLLSNALKYSPADTTVRIALARAGGDRVRLCVSAQGPGVRPEEMERLFQRYTCLSARPTGGEPSTGLGLSIVKELVGRMGGKVRCESGPGPGSAFLVELPAATIAPANIAPSPDPVVS